MNISSTPLGFLEYWGIYRAKGGLGGTRGGHNPPGRAWASWRALVDCAPLRGTPLVLLWPTGSLPVQKKSPKSFAAFGLRLVLIFCDVKNKQKTTTSIGHYVNRLVPKNDIKLI